MAKLSAVIIAKDAEEVIGDCIDSLRFCDEVLVIDDGSKDRTAEVAKILNAKVFSHISESFSEQRNFGLKRAKYPWILYVDADERISKELADNIKKVVDTKNTQYGAYKIVRKNFYFGNHEWPYIEKLERLFKKSDLEEWYGDLHETPKVKGEIGELEGFLLHYTHQNLTSMVEKTIKWSEVEAELRFKSHHPSMSWWRFYRVIFTAFYDSYIRQKGYKAGTVGLIESIYQAFSIFITYARLWEKQKSLE